MRYGRAAAWLIAGALTAAPWFEAPMVAAESVAAPQTDAVSGAPSAANDAKPPAAQVADGANTAGTAMDEAAWEAALAAGATVSAVHGTGGQAPVAAQGTKAPAASPAAHTAATAAEAAPQTMPQIEPMSSTSTSTAASETTVNTPAESPDAAASPPQVSADVGQAVQPILPETLVENADLSPNAAERVKELMQKFRLLGDPKRGAYSWIYTSPIRTAEAVSRSAAGSSYFLLAGKECLRFQSLDCDEVWYFHEGCGLKMTVLLIDGTVRTFELGAQGQAMPMILIPKGQIFAAENISVAGYSFISCMTIPALDTTGIHVYRREDLLERYPQAKETIERYTDAPPVQNKAASVVSAQAATGAASAAGDASAGQERR